MLPAPLTYQGRLPGVVCQAALPPAAEDPLRLDVAGFIGFAERGPLNTPVALEDLSQYQAVFGRDLAIARDGGLPVYAALPGAVQAFFDNGGRRCYAVRVAGAAAWANRFRLPGLVARDDSGRFTLAVAPAAWVGRWSDTMSVGTQLRSRPLRIAQPGGSPPDPHLLGWPAPEINLEVPTATTVRQGDLLRVRMDAIGEPLLLFMVANVVPGGRAAATTRGLPITAQADRATVQAFTERLPAPLPMAQTVLRRRPDGGWDPLPPPSAGILSVTDAGGQDYALDFPAGTELRAGDLLRVTTLGGVLLTFPVARVAAVPPVVTSPPSPAGVRAISTMPLPHPIAVEQLGPDGWELLPVAGPGLDLGPDAAGRGATLTLPAAGGSPPLAPVRIGDLLRILCMGGAAIWFPVRSLGWRQGEGSPPGAPDQQVLGSGLLWEAPWGPTTPVAPPSEADLLSFDLLIREGGDVMETWSELRFGPGPGYWADVLVKWADDSPAGPPALPPTTSTRLRAPAAALSAQPPLFLPLGMNVVPGPDTFAGPLPIGDPNTMPGKDGLDEFDPLPVFLDAALRGVGARDLMTEAERLVFLSPTPRRLHGIHALATVDEVGLIAVPDLAHRRWPYAEALPEIIVPPPPAPPPPDWSHFQNCPQPALPMPPALDPCGQPYLLEPGEPAPLTLLQQLALLPAVEPISRYDAGPLLAVQQAVIELCAARADQLAVLSLPGHFGVREALDWQQQLTNRGALRDGATLSYAAVYHPWLQTREEVTPELTPLRAVPPDGAVSGMIAARELARGPWVAPANVPLRGVVGLAPVLSEAAQVDLFNRQINLVRQRPGVFSTLSAHTLSLDRLLLQISVRRLIIFLRKLALRRGQKYVFETNNERFRQRVQTAFERTMQQLLARGALTAFQVSTGPDVNTANDYDNGRLIIALKIAPTLPIEFITVVLLRSGEGLLQIVER